MVRLAPIPHSPPTETFLGNDGCVVLKSAEHRRLIEIARPRHELAPGEYAGSIAPASDAKTRREAILAEMRGRGLLEPGY